VNALWIYVIIGVVAVLLIVGIVIGAIVLWKRQVKRSLISLTGRREAIIAAYKALEMVFTALADGTAEELAEFATDPMSVHRKALEELHTRMAMQSEELATLPLPKSLWHAADLLAAAASKLAKEVGRVGEADSPEAVLNALGEIDVAGIRATITPMTEEIERQLAVQKISDPSVYGGGMYI
jgi:hypothetical protein